ncbi:MAG: alpha-glucan family phosphorylase [Actinobacteria bacterium]|nr:alpha-glucan family phosphorylase [Actinomycetota bacterium]
MKKNLTPDEKLIAYFSMEIGIDSKIPTYSGGLGILAGDTIRSCADLKVPIVAVTLIYKKGYFYQKLDEFGQQIELPYNWNPGNLLDCLQEKVSIELEGRNVYIQAWQYTFQGLDGFHVPIIFLDTDIEENNNYDRTLTYYLYGGDEKYRLSQEIILGIGGVRMLEKLNYSNIKKYHMNEGHSSLLTIELLKKSGKDAKTIFDTEEIRKKCIFTTHTPVPASHDQFSYDLVQKLLNDFISIDFLKKVGGEERLNMTLLALNLSNYINGVSKEHGKISKGLYPNYPIDSITNGIHSATWICESFKELYNKYIPEWAHDPFSLRYTASIPKEEIWDAHRKAKFLLVNYANKNKDNNLDLNVFTIGFARRATAYKRADLVFYDTEKIIDISKKAGKMQFIFSGKAHPKDFQGKELIKKTIDMSQKLKNEIKIVYLENYDIDLAKMLISGVDLWLNTPQKPNEASGTSGMKAAHNGIPSLSILDGWWIEGCIEGVTGWSIDSVNNDENLNAGDAYSLYSKLENEILPVFYNNQDKWIDIMRYTISINASFFNTHRMVHQYITNAYAF